MNLNLPVTNVFERTLNAFQKWEADHDSLRHLVHQGGTRSGKTYAICQFIIFYLIPRYPGAVITICRKTFTELKGSVMRDFFEILQDHGLYQPQFHNKSDHHYYMNDCLVEFIGLDKGEKRKGHKRQFLFINEITGLTLEDYIQLIIRTDDLIIADFNPSDPLHFVMDQIIPREDTTFIHSTYKDNPFLGRALIKEIEHLAQIDTEYDKVYRLGLPSTIKGQVWTNWKICTNEEYLRVRDQSVRIFYGYDDGWVDPIALVEIVYHEGIAYVDELFYGSYTKVPDMLDEVEERLEHLFPIYVEHNPVAKQEFLDRGYQAFNADKDRDEGIKFVRKIPMRVTERSDNIRRDLNYFRYKIDDNNKVTPVIEDKNDHGPDAIRYGMYTHLKHIFKTA